jgi:hypothetical protein
LFRVDRRQDQKARPSALRPTVHGAQAEEPVVPDQHRACPEDDQGREDDRGRIKVFDPRNQTPALPSKVPAFLEEQFRERETAWENFTRFPPSYQRMTIGWVASAKQEATQLRRLQRLIAESEANRRIKFM